METPSSKGNARAKRQVSPDHSLVKQIGQQSQQSAKPSEPALATQGRQTIPGTPFDAALFGEIFSSICGGDTPPSDNPPRAKRKRTTLYKASPHTIRGCSGTPKDTSLGVVQPNFNSLDDGRVVLEPDVWQRLSQSANQTATLETEIAALKKEAGTEKAKAEILQIRAASQETKAAAQDARVEGIKAELKKLKTEMDDLKAKEDKLKRNLELEIVRSQAVKELLEEGRGEAGNSSAA